MPRILCKVQTSKNDVGREDVLLAAASVRQCVVLAGEFDGFAAVGRIFARQQTGREGAVLRFDVFVPVIDYN